MTNTNYNINIVYDYNVGYYIASMPEIKGLAVTASSQTASLSALIATASSSYWPDQVNQPLTLKRDDGVTVYGGSTYSSGPLISVTLNGTNGTTSTTYTTVIPNNPNFI